MNKKLLSVFFAVLLCVVVSVPAFADTAEDYTPHLIDNADLLTGEEESNLLAKLDEISDRLSVDVAVVTEDSIGDKTPREYADDFYDYNSYKYNPDGVLLLISMEERDWYITTTGSAITAITDARRGNMEDAFLSDLSGGYYYDAFSTYAPICATATSRACRAVTMRKVRHTRRAPWGISRGARRFWFRLLSASSRRSL